MRRASESSLVSCIVYQSSLHTLSGCYCEETCDDTAHHTGAQTPERCQSTSFGILERVLNIVKTEEPNAIFSNTADCKCRTAFVKRSQPFLLVYIRDNNEWILRCWYAFLLTQLYTRLRKLERVL